MEFRKKKKKKIEKYANLVSYKRFSIIVDKML